MLSKAFNTGTAWHKEYRHGEDLFVDCDEAFLHKDAEAGGEGLACTDTELINSMRKIIIDIGKQLGRKLLSGHLNLINISLPVVMFEPRSYLQKLADPWVHPVHLERAAACSDPVERMKLTVTWFVAGLQHVFSSWRKPFNPVLGETWQAELPSGTKIFTEQVSHHPPVTAFHMEGRAGLYTFDGLSQPQVSFSNGGLKTSARGYRRITFASDGAVITIKYPYYRIGGLISGVPHGLIKGTATLTDTKYNITATVTFGPVPGAVSRLLSRSDSLSVQIQGSAAAAAAVIAVPEWIATAAAVDRGGLGGGFDATVRPVAAAAAAAAAEGLFDPVQAGRVANTAERSEKSTIVAAAAAAEQARRQERGREQRDGNTGQELFTSAPPTTEQLLQLNSTNRSSSHDASVVITSRRRSKSSSSIRSPFNWLSKPSRPSSSSSKSSSKKSSRSSSNSSSRQGAASSRYRSSGPGFGACFGRFDHQDLPKALDLNNESDASSGSSRGSSPDISRAHSSRSCPEPRELSTPTTPPPDLSPAAAAAAAAAAAEVEQALEGPTRSSPRPAPHAAAAAAGVCSSPRSRLGASSPGPMSGFHSRQVTEQVTSPSMQNVTCRPAGHTTNYQEQQQQQQPSGVTNSVSNTACGPQVTSVATEDASVSCNSSFCSSSPSSSSSSDGESTAVEGQILVQQQRQQQWNYCNQPQQLLASGTGNWLSHLDFTGQRYLTLSDDLPEHWVSLHDLTQQQPQQQHVGLQPLPPPPPPQQGRQYHVQQQQQHQQGGSCDLQLLPSDSQLRDDLVAFRQREPTAQQMKEHLEHQQRRDAKLRPHFPHIDCAQGD